MNVLAPIVACEGTEYGWRGLTAKGELLEVHNGSLPTGEVLVTRNGEVVGTREVMPSGFDLSAYLWHTKRAVDLYQLNRSPEALHEIEMALAVRDTAQARLNRSIILLSLGRWREGFAAHEARFEMYMTPRHTAVADRIPRWFGGSDISGKRLMLVHDAGLGDSIMCARYIPLLQEAGAEVLLNVPQSLTRFLGQLAPAVDEDVGADLFCPLYSLPLTLRQDMETIPTEPYLKPDPGLLGKWRARLDPTVHKIGIAWNVGAIIEGDYPREAPLELFVERLAPRGRLYSIQAQGHGEALAHGVTAYPFEDFADCAAFVSLLDEIITIDTAALHVAGAIGHPRVTVLLSHWASWRFLGNRFYPTMQLCYQTEPGDWSSAFEQIGDSHD